MISVQLYSVREQFAADPDGTLERLAAIGFAHVEPYGFLENASELRMGLLQYGLTAPTVHAKLIGQEQEDIFEAALDGGVSVVFEPFVPAEKWEKPGDIAATADALSAAAKIAVDYGLRVGYHNHWWELRSRIDGKSALEFFAEQLDPDVVLEVDTYWATAGGEDVPALLRRLGDRVHAIHVKDGGLATDGTGQVPAGQGSVPVAEILAVNPNVVRVAEFDAYDGDMFEALAASYAYLTAHE
jgi:sugar phosphate isomerase/epimerase